MIIATTMTVSVMSMLAVMVSQVIRANATSAEHLDDIRTLAALGRQLRGDVRAAARVTVSAPDATTRGLTLTAADGATVEYTIDGRAIERAGKSNGANQPPRREVYQLNIMRAVDWKQDGREVTLTVARRAAPLDQSAASATFDIVAVLGDETPATLSP